MVTGHRLLCTPVLATHIGFNGRTTMRHFRKRSIAVLGLLVCATTSASAEDLLEIYRLALMYDPVLREAEASYLARREIMPQARSFILPTLSLGLGGSIGFQQDPNRPTNFATGQPDPDIVSTEFERDASNWSLRLNQTVFNWGAVVGLKQAEKQVAQAETDLEITRQDLLVRVAISYFQVLAAEDTLGSETTAREAIGRQLEQAQRRFEVGLIAITDVQEAQAGYDQAIAAEIGAQQNVATTREFLREIVGESIMDLAGPMDEIPLMRPDPDNAEVWVQRSLDGNLALISSRIASDIALDSVAILRSVRYPTVSLSGNLAESGSSTTRINNLVANPPCLDSPVVRCPPEETSSRSAAQSYSFSLNFSVPIYSGGINSSRIQQAVYQHRATLEALERVARATERQTRDAYLSVISEIARVRALRQAVESSATALRATEAGFEVGTRTIVDVLVSQNNLLRAQTTYARSRYDYILNILRLKQAAGDLTIEDIEEVNGWLEG